MSEEATTEESLHRAAARAKLVGDAKELVKEAMSELVHDQTFMESIVGSPRFFDALVYYITTHVYYRDTMRDSIFPTHTFESKVNDIIKSRMQAGVEKLFKDY